MNKLKVGEKLKIHKYKHNGEIDRCWEEATFLSEDENYMIFANYKTLVIEKNGRMWKTKEPAIMYFSKKNWFNIIAQIKKNGIYYYCNIASPFIIEDKVIKYIDYDLDLRVFPTGAFKVLDRGEYKYHKKIMNYSKKLDYIIRSELTKLIEIARNKAYPFSIDSIERNYQKYLNVKSINKQKIEV